jgi:hypothetical protein
MAYTDREAGHLMLIDQHKHKQTIAGAGRAAAGVVDRRRADRVGAEERPQEVHAGLGEG